MKNKPTLARSLERFKFSAAQRIALLCCNYIPILHVLLMVCTICVPWAPLRWRVSTAADVLYILPPILAHCVLTAWPIKEGAIPVPSLDYFVWWVVLNLQTIFCRLSFLEELMRIVPGAYSAWLRLWGSRIGSFMYWAAGLRILDRSFLDINDARRLSLVQFPVVVVCQLKAYDGIGQAEDIDGLQNV